MRGIDKVRLIALWDGKNDMSEDLDVHLVKHMVDLMRATGGMVEQINPTKLTIETIENVADTVGNQVTHKISQKTVEIKKPPSKSRSKKKKKK
jgi:hypothetical protein